MTKVMQEMEALRNEKRSHDSIFKGIHKQHFNKMRRKKENRRKSNGRKRKRTESNVQRMYGICVGNPQGNALYTLLPWPSRKSVSNKVEDVATSLFRQDGPYITQLLVRKRIISVMMKEAESPLTFSKKSDWDTMFFTFLCPEEYTVDESISKTDSHSRTSGEKELYDSEDEDECQ